MSLIWIDCIRRMKTEPKPPRSKSNAKKVVQQQPKQQQHLQADIQTERPVVNLEKKVKRKVSFSHRIVQASYKVEFFAFQKV